MPSLIRPPTLPDHPAEATREFRIQKLSNGWTERMVSLLRKGSMSTQVQTASLIHLTKGRRERIRIHPAHAHTRPTRPTAHGDAHDDTARERQKIEKEHTGRRLPAISSTQRDEEPTVDNNGTTGKAYVHLFDDSLSFGRVVLAWTWI